MRSTTSLLIAFCFATCLTVPPAVAGGPILRVQGQVTSSDGDALGLGDDFGTSAGAYVGLEWRLNERLGIEAGLGWTELEQSGTVDGFIAIIESTATLTINPVTVALNVHLTPGSRYDVYLAPRIGWAFLGDLEIRNEINFSNLPGIPGFPGIPLPTFPTVPGFPTSQTVDIPVEDQFVYGLRLGFDAPFGNSAWSFSSSLDLLGVDLELDFGATPRPGRNISSPAVALDPISLGLGFAYRF